MNSITFPEAIETIWTTQGGERIPVSKLQDDHLRNIHRQLHQRIVMFGVINTEMKRRGLNPHPVAVKRLMSSVSYEKAIDSWAEYMKEVGFNAEDMQAFC